MLEQYNLLSEKYTKQLNLLKQKDNLIGWIRALLFLYFIASSIYLYQQSSINFVIINLVICIALFLVLVSKNQDVLDKIDYCKSILEVINNEILKIKNQFDYSSIDGKLFVDSEHFFSSDFDVFDDNGLFSRIDRTRTLNAKTILAKQLKELCFDTEQLKNRQNAIQELAHQKTEWAINFIASIQPEKVRDLKNKHISEWQQLNFYASINKYILAFWVLVNITIIVLAINAILPNISIVLLLMFDVFVHYRFFKHRESIAQKIIAYKNFFNNYLVMLKILEQENFKSELLVKYKTLVEVQSKNFIKEFEKFNKTVNALESTIKNAFVNFINHFIYLDIFYIKNINEWNNKNNSILFESIKTINELEVLISYALFYNVHHNFTFPTFIEDGAFQLEAKKLGHPLLFDKQCITNDFSINEHNLFIITGANMAGKSTFLRTVGCNIILALNGLPVFAEQLKLKPIQLFTSMRSTDSIDKSNSYFLSEVKRLKQLIDELKKGNSYFIILDEILMGTNSEDKLEGSKLFIEKIIQMNLVSGLLATHDIPLTQLEQKYPHIIQNFKFEADIQTNDSIQYDYKLKKGVVTQMNAMHLMKTLDIV